jgi:hypothetical protein
MSYDRAEISLYFPVFIAIREKPKDGKILRIILQPLTSLTVLNANVEYRRLLLSKFVSNAEVVFASVLRSDEKALTNLRFVSSQRVDAFTVTFDYMSPLYPIIQELIAAISRNYNLNEIAAAEQLYNSKLYAQLEVEETKIWHLSVPALMNLFINEYNTGELNLEGIL